MQCERSTPVTTAAKGFQRVTQNFPTVLVWYYLCRQGRLNGGHEISKTAGKFGEGYQWKSLRHRRRLSEGGGSIRVGR
jgi:hypothetical protein